ncbi:MAG TPA: hypothetical protein ENG14_06000 [Thermodesulforhabdus norvegica]|uniref:Uncharacterized protein n=1 Tax=Thermodesulforhabdus norvegica TaxID=39841 RepID=A0A7C1AV12_9BACT|nr:hypothetical protein [Deltaproteobacteria bacterium]MBW2067666.1 hypothetical protein [Deltaproteobacteria bacterium]HDL90439.1 hypothetical protein [Thermodesulforhabdus norvegica]
MARGDFRPDGREAAVISRLDHAKEAQKMRALRLLKKHLDELSERITSRLIEVRAVETTSKIELEQQVNLCLQSLLTAEDFDIQYQTAEIRHIVPRPHFISLYVTAWIIEKLIDHKCIIDIYGTDEEIYRYVNAEVSKMIPMN